MKVRYVDFAGMYPSLFTLIGLWPFLVAERIEYVEATDEIQQLVQRTDLDILRDPTVWQQMVAIVEVQPQDDILPARAHYGEKHGYNIGIVQLESSRRIWCTLADVLGSKLLTGRSPNILRAIKFVPKGRQSGLLPIQIVGGSVVNPDQDLFHRLRELRKNVQHQRGQHPEGSQARQNLETIQNILKIITNATSYGVFIEVIRDHGKCEADVYGLEHFRSKASKEEHFGPFFHPVVSTTLTSGARLLLAMAETWLQQHGSYYAFCDTDSLAVKPFNWTRLQQIFEPLNTMPEERFLRPEKENYENNRLADLWFYGISSKRYVLYRFDEKDELIPVKWSSHGLGHLIHEKESQWEKELWVNILRTAHGRLSKQELLEHYANEYAVSKLAITTPHLLCKFKAINRGKSFKQQIKPYNLVLVGSATMTGPTGKPISPMTAMNLRHDLAPYQPFTDARTGRPYQKNTHVYWKKLDRLVEEYMDHPESKFENGNRSGTMHRRHLMVNEITYMGKEANELELNEVLGIDDETYVEYAPISPPRT
jgi:hypothetical protein